MDVMVKKALEMEDVYPKAIANFMFYEIAREYDIPQDDLEAMRKKAVNRASALLAIINNDDLKDAFAVYGLGGSEWEEPELTEEVEQIMQMLKDLTE